MLLFPVLMAVLAKYGVLGKARCAITDEVSKDAHCLEGKEDEPKNESGLMASKDFGIMDADTTAIVTKK